MADVVKVDVLMRSGFLYMSDDNTTLRVEPRDVAGFVRRVCEITGRDHLGRLPVVDPNDSLGVWASQLRPEPSPYPKNVDDIIRVAMALQSEYDIEFDEALRVIEMAKGNE